MDIQAIYDLLKDNGFMLFTKFPGPLFTPSDVLSFSKKEIDQRANRLINELFTPIGYYMYMKGKLGGKRKSRKFKRNKSKKNKL
jgi:hypothetical protein